MNIYLSKQSFVRIITFSAALIITLIAFTAVNINESDNSKNKLNYVYLRNIEQLATSTDNIKNTLSKGIYCGTPNQLANISAKLWNDASNAKQALSSLPLKNTQTDNINRFLSQVGNYSVSVSKKATDGDVLTLDEYVKLAQLYDYSEVLSKQMWDLEKKAQSGLITFEETKDLLSDKKTAQTPSITEGFKSFEDGIDKYPTLIYDGPFSDHILDRQPEMLKNIKTVELSQALKTASEFTGVSTGKLKNRNDEAGKMPSYCFDDGENTYIGVTKAGGYVSYMMKSRRVDTSRISINDALSSGTAFLLNKGYANVVTTYYETVDNICTINFAYLDDNVTIYTDLIKVSVAMDNGEILGFDGRGYIVNHHNRTMTDSIISAQQAQKSLSPLLTVEKTKLAIIPTSGQNEVLTYEFLCSSRKGQRVLVYVNAKTNDEEQILIMFESPESVLTM